MITKRATNKICQWTAPRTNRFEVEMEVAQTGRDSIGADWIPVELPDVSLMPGNIDPASFRVVAYDKSGQPIVFDPDICAPGCYEIPCRFEPDNEGEALALNPRRGRLVFPVRPTPRRQRFCFYFNRTTKKQPVDSIPAYGGLIGDGDVFTQKHGALAVPGQARPVLMGEGLCRRRGLVVASSYGMGIYFFEDVSRGKRSAPDFVNRGRLLDVNGRVIAGIPAFHDLTGNGLLDMVIGLEEGGLVWHRNIGTADMPRFKPAVPLCDAEKRPLNIQPFLRGKFAEIKDKQGRLNKRYPRMPLMFMHGGRCHLNPVPVFVPAAHDNSPDLIVGARGGFFIYFKRTPAGFDSGRLIMDTAGNPLRIDSIVCFPTCAPEARAGRIVMWAGDYHGQIFRLVQADVTDGLPVFHPPVCVNAAAEVEYSFPLAVKRGGRTDLWVGDFHGHVKYFRQTGRNAAGQPHFDDGRLVVMQNAWIVHHMPIAHYQDINGDRICDIVSGDVKGGVYGYRNLGTNKNPLFNAGRLLSAGESPLIVQGGPDPISTADGYSKPLPAAISGVGTCDLLVGTGMGRIMYFRFAGMDSDGLPRFCKGVVLRDTRGGLVRCHHMAGVTLADWDGDGVPDLIVGGQSRVHAAPDDDDDPSQVRFYKGVRQGRRLRFRPYKPLTAEGDGAICNRPVALNVLDAPADRRLIVNRMCFRQINPAYPEKLEFDCDLPAPWIKAREKCLTAYATFARIEEHDRLIVQGSVVGCLFAFRAAFVNQGGYLGARFRRGRPHAKGHRPPALSGKTASPPCRVREKIKHRLSGRLPVHKITGNINARRSVIRELNKIPAVELRQHDAWLMPQSDHVTVRIAAGRDALFMAVDVSEPLMERLICLTDHHNGPLEVDDRVEIYFDIDSTARGRAPHFYSCMINHRGFIKEMNLRRDNGRREGPWRAGDCPLEVDADIRADGFRLIAIMPWAKWGLAWPADAGRCRIDIKRRRHLYANEIRAKEQRLSSTSSLSGCESGWLRLTVV